MSEKENKVRTSIAIFPSIFDSVKLVAMKQATSNSKVIETALLHYFSYLEELGDLPSSLCEVVKLTQPDEIDTPVPALQSYLNEQLSKASFKELNDLETAAFDAEAELEESGYDFDDEDDF